MGSGESAKNDQEKKLINFSRTVAHHIKFQRIHKEKKRTK